MSKKVKRMLSFLIAIVIVTTLFTACTKKEDTGTQDDAGKEKTTTGVDKEPTGLDNSKLLEISWFGFNGTEIVEGNPLQKEIEEKFNVKIKNVKADIFNSEQINLMINSGEMPDASFMYQSPIDLWEKGVTRSIPRSFIEQYSPNFKKLLDRYPIGWKLNVVPDKEDEYLAINGINLAGDGDGWVSYYRLDWLENVGIKPKGELIPIDEDGHVFFCETPFTLEEQDEIFDAFLKMNTDTKNPKYAMSGNKDTTNYSWETILNSFGVKTWMNLEEGGKYIQYYQSNKWKEALKLLNNYYKKGYIDQEWTSQDLTKHWEKLNSGMVGWWPNFISYVNPSYQDRPPFGILAKVPNAKMLITPPEIGPNGKQYFCPGNPSPHNYNYPSFIGHGVDDEKLARILQIFDYLCFDKEAQVKYHFGFEGQHFTWQGEPYNSGISAKEDVTPKVQGEYGLRFYKFVMYDENMAIYLSQKEQIPMINWVKVGNYESIDNWRHDIFGELQEEYDKLGKQIGSDVSMIWQEFYMKAITGEIDIDSEWDNYLKRIEEAGIGKQNEIGNKAPLFAPLLKGDVKY
jgi:putative aldouronate transport system substrate-binding protein